MDFKEGRWRMIDITINDFLIIGIGFCLIQIFFIKCIIIPAMCGDAIDESNETELGK